MERREATLQQSPPKPAAEARPGTHPAHPRHDTQHPPSLSWSSHKPLTHGKAFQQRAERRGNKPNFLHLCAKVPEIQPICWRFLRAGGRGGWRRPGLSLGVAMAARSSFQTWLYQQSSDGSACDRLKPRG